MSRIEQFPTAEGSAMPKSAETIVHSFAASPAFSDDRLCFCAGSAGLYRSDDGGVVWRSALDSLFLTMPLTTTAVAFSPNFATDRIIIAGAYGGIIRSCDGGDSWAVVSLSSPPPLISCLAFSPNFKESGVVFACSIEDGIFRSNDRGRSWTKWNFGLLDLCVLSLALSPKYASDETLFVGTETEVAVSTNGGHSWRELSLPNDAGAVLSLATTRKLQSGSPCKLFAGTTSGVWCTDDAQQWTQTYFAESSAPVNRMYPCNFRGHSALLLSAGDAVIVSFDEGQNWSELPLHKKNAGDIADIAIVTADTTDLELLIVWRQGTVSRSKIPCSWI